MTSEQIHRDYLNRYNRKRYTRVKWEKRFGKTLKELDNQPLNGDCDLCGARVQWFLKQPYMHGRICQKCAQVLKYFKDDPELLRHAAAYLNLVTEKWEYDSSKVKNRYHKNGRAKRNNST